MGVRSVRSSSYARLMSLPPWGLYDAEGKLIATIRAHTAMAARELFRAHGYALEGGRVRKV